MMMFEYDQDKSDANLAKHGIDFMKASNLWNDVDRLEIPAMPGSEARTLLIAKLKDKCWTAIFTMRGESIRLISVRRARDNERQEYENQE